MLPKKKSTQCRKADSAKDQGTDVPYAKKVFVHGTSAQDQSFEISRHLAKITTIRPTLSALLTAKRIWDMLVFPLAMLFHQLRESSTGIFFFPLSLYSL